MAIVINGSGTITGISAGGLPDGTVTADDLASTLDLSGKTVTGVGITEADIFELTSSFSPGGTALITANLSRSNDSGVGTIGSGMSESSGVFTFPSTGYWIIHWIQVASHSSNDGSNSVELQYTSDNSTYSVTGVPAHAGQRVVSDPTLSASSFNILDITDTANQKVRFNCVSFNPTVLNSFSVMFLKIGET